MELKELQHEVEDLEPRIERLKALYEQYFMGLEKMEPAVLRRDVDRKLWQLRKLRIQNTALRFRLQMLIQRYNTYQQYWGRVMREMERGTYRRDVLRAAKRIGSKEAMTIVGKRRAKMFEKLAGEQAARRSRAADLAEQQASELEAALSGPSDGADAGAAPPPSGATSLSPASLEDPSQWSFSDPPTGEWQRAGRPTIEDPPTAEWVGRADDLNDDEAPTLPPPAPSAEAHPRPTGSATARGQRAVPSPPVADSVTPALTAFSTDSLAPPRVPSATAPTAAKRPQPPPSSRRPLPPPSSRRPLPPPAQGSPVPPPRRSEPGARPPARPERRPAPPPPPAKTPRPSPPPAAGRQQPADRMRRLYDDYVDAKRGANESTDGLSIDKLERSLRKQTERLRKKHGNKQIDYEVVTQNGRPLIRPKIK